ncbi:MAG: AAC(3) family N-acetyltransferase [Catenulispora sp.]|nr:AAC(3) family N-acetyltransferase [Catenulispora sp.]
MLAAWTRATLAEQLDRLGLAPSVDSLVHASMRAVGWVDGGPAALLGALQDVLGPAATVVVPAQTTQYSTSSTTHRAMTAGLDAAARRALLSALPPFDPARTPSAGMGIFAEYVRTRPAARRSAHPTSSFAALGPAAEELTAVHPRECHLGESSPLGALARRGAQVLLLGVGFDKATAFHLAEYRLTPRRRVYYSKVHPANTWEPYPGIVLDASDFAAIGAAMRDADWVRSGQVGAGVSVTFPMAPAVEFARTWMLRMRVLI